jgi:hypothetical protein
MERGIKMLSKVKRVETIIIKLVIIQLLFMLVAQWILQNDEWAVHFNQSIYYEGVVNGSNTKAVETLDQ